MSHEAFQQAIYDEPDDDALRLIYADWLDDHGESLWGELIRIQCDLASSTPTSEGIVSLQEREIELSRLLLCKLDIFESNPDHLKVSDFLSLPRITEPNFGPIGASWDVAPHRGFPHVICLDQRGVPDSYEDVGAVLSSRLTDLRASTPFQSLTFENFEIQLLSILFDQDFVSALRQLRISIDNHQNPEEPPEPEKLVSLLAETPQLSGLRLLALNAPGENLRLLADSPHLQSLEHLILEEFDLLPKSLEELSQSSLAKQLTTLEISSRWMTDDHVKALVKGDWPRLHTLKLWGRISLSALEIVAEHDGMPLLASLSLMSRFQAPKQIPLIDPRPNWSLRRLALCEFHPGTDGIAALASSPILSELHTLELWHNEITTKGFSSLAKSDYLRNLQHLEIVDDDLKGGQMKELTQGDLLRQLTTFNLAAGTNPLPCTFREGAQLIEAMNLDSIRHLKLSGIPLGARGANVLANQSWIRKLRLFELKWGRILDDGVETLFNALNHNQLAYLSLIEPRLSEEMKKWIREQPVGYPVNIH